ncbi:RNA-guided endonuclease InsQ/TnpB family protein [Nitrosomonas cryotolerans]|jgi:putative transposase|uniref:Putative transposase n=2 Tax=Nitrosomonas cryotolerans TaxID=44575 RepID=A0A1N6HLX4_9PROT|nr:RNA-guided endonuclease TnpB family protein [Nitrosomonas cryotolerans]SIO04875.1 putative transposase [Nitrosomonas cryotolerans ATCC 49181]SIO12957.1 putative transposase [Nitrosomonas cryotolerans ATCC 49181]SIO20736.1 putative transposase [Nitrosomonas cryotolerans ATCC 49181]SIO27083.1 putative transposase [Nitrosomonas cryotolerans ATCC 49181]SIO32077.1 putative transposase [Nitrosomonas cryotolerans ATCC 49181]
MKQIIRKAFKSRLNPNSDQVQKMVEFAGANRFVWNKALAMNLFRLEQKQPLLWYNELSFWLKLWKSSEDYGFLKTVHSQPLQQALKNLEKAFKDGFDKKQPLKRIPKFKKKGLSDSFRYPQGFKLEQESSKVFLPKIGWVKYRNSRQVIGDVKNMTISRKGGYWYVSIQTEYETELKRHSSTSMIGVDMGVTRFATLSDGSYVEPLNSFRKLSKKLAFEQRKLSKKVRFSANWKKQKQIITRLHERIANARLDFLHKTSTEISKNHAMVVVENLKIGNMSKSAKGSVEKHGKNVKAKSGLNKSILDQGWGMFVSFLEYKQACSGGDVLKVNPQYTSQTCPRCQHVSRDNRKSQSAFECTECGFKANADLVGALNVLERGHRLLACGVETLVSSKKQEPVGSSNTNLLLTA